VSPGAAWKKKKVPKRIGPVIIACLDTSARPEQYA
jgi:hypothetical protein